MPRRARLSIPGIPWHIIQRGNNRSVCFYAEEDYLLYLHYLDEFATKFGCAIHAYVLMTNHVHLLLTPHEADAAGRLMKLLGQRYVQRVNRLYRRSGTLWEGRFRSCVVQDGVYLLGCSRYIELHPAWRTTSAVRPTAISHWATSASQTRWPPRSDDARFPAHLGGRASRLGRLRAICLRDRTLAKKTVAVPSFRGFPVDDLGSCQYNLEHKLYSVLTFDHDHIFNSLTGHARQGSRCQGEAAASAALRVCSSGNQPDES